MPIRFGKRVFAPRLAPTLATLLVLPGLVALGFWQLDRAALKEHLRAEYAAGASRAVDVPTADVVRTLPRYQRVRLRGRYDPDRQLLLDNMTSRLGQPGYHVLTPLVLADGTSVLVNRGWLPLGATRTAMPDVSVATAVREIEGRIDALPRPGLRLEEPVAIKERAWPLVVSYPTFGQLEPLYGDGLAERIVLLDPDAAGGYERAWQERAGFGPERHLAYAVQWFALAVALVALYAGLNLKRAPPIQAVRQD